MKSLNDIVSKCIETNAPVHLSQKESTDICRRSVADIDEKIEEHRRAQRAHAASVSHIEIN